MTITNLGENLIFIISQPRAGSTLLQRVIANHPDVGTLSEPWIMLHPIYGLRRTGIETEYVFSRSRIALDDFLTQLPNREDTYICAIREMACVLYNEACDFLGKPRFLDKTPTYYLIIPELYKVFPKASFIILLRNPLAVLNSILNTWVKGDWTKLGNHYQNLLVAPEKLLEGIQVVGDSGVVIHYESFVQNPKSVTQKICNHIGIRFNENMLHYGHTTSHSRHMGDPTGVNQFDRPVTDSLNKWIEMGQNKQTRMLAQDYLKALDHDTVSSMGYDYAAMRNAIDSVKCKETGHVISWRKAFKPNKTFRENAQFLTIEFIQKRSLIHSLKQFAKLVLGKK